MKPDYWDRAKRALARNDPVMAAIIRSRPKVFLARRGEPFVTLARAIVGQQISVKAAQSVWDKVCLCAGAVTPQSVLARKRSELRACGLSERKVEYIARSAMYSTLRSDRPQARSSLLFLARTLCGVTAPAQRQTLSQTLCAALTEICWPTMARASVTKGSPRRARNTFGRERMMAAMTGSFRASARLARSQ